MKTVLINIPYPPSVNKTYYNRVIATDPLKKNKLRGRGLTKEARDYKKTVASLIYYQFNNQKFEDNKVKVTILDNPINDMRDNHNCLKIVFDAIELSGLINNDRQIIAHEIIPGEFQDPPSWTLKIEIYPYKRGKIAL